MKMRVMILTMLAALVLIVGCGRADRNRIEDGGESAPLSWEGTGYMSEEAAVDYRAAPAAYMDMSNLLGQAIDKPSLPDTSNSAAMPEDTRKLVKRASISIRVEDLEKADISITELLKNFNGYSASTNVREYEYSYSLRVPAPQFDVFLSEIGGMGKLIYRTESTEDVTLQFYDLEGRLESRRELLRTFQSYLRRANNMDEILTVETRIADIQREIDNTGTKLRNLTDRIDYATIELRIQGPVTSAKYKGVTFGDKIKQLFGGFGDFLSSTAVVLLGIIVYGVPILALLALLFWVLFGKIGLLKKLWRLVAAK